jgi:hypothetical protein
MHRQEMRLGWLCYHRWESRTHSGRMALRYRDPDQSGTPRIRIQAVGSRFAVPSGSIPRARCPSPRMQHRARGEEACQTYYTSLPTVTAT